jgi:hypothetical protein
MRQASRQTALVTGSKKRTMEKIVGGVFLHCVRAANIAADNGYHGAYDDLMDLAIELARVERSFEKSDGKLRTRPGNSAYPSPTLFSSRAQPSDSPSRTGPAGLP